MLVSILTLTSVKGNGDSIKLFFHTTFTQTIQIKANSTPPHVASNALDEFIYYIVLLYLVPQNCIPYITVPNACNQTICEKYDCTNKHGPRTSTFWANCQIGHNFGAQGTKEYKLEIFPTSPPHLQDYTHL